MKKLYLILLMLLILFIPMSINAVAVYQLDQPVFELNGYTLREVFETNQMLLNNQFDFDVNNWSAYNSTINKNSIYSEAVNEITSSNHGYIYQNGISFNNNDYIYIRSKRYLDNSDALYINYSLNGTGGGSNYYLGPILKPIANRWYEKSIKYQLIDYSGSLEFALNQEYENSTIAFGKKQFIDYIYMINQTALGISHLTVEQMDIYFKLYLEAVRFEQENIQASQDIGGYQNIFKSIINGVKNLMTEMGNVWQFLNAPIMTTDIRDFKFEVDWSWDLIGMLGQVLSSVQVLTLQVVLLVPSLVFQLFGIPIQVSILSLLFSNFIFLVLGWIIVKSFLI